MKRQGDVQAPGFGLQSGLCCEGTENMQGINVNKKTGGSISKDKHSSFPGNCLCEIKQFKIIVSNETFSNYSRTSIVTGKNLPGNVITRH